MLTIWAFDWIENMHTLYRGKDGMKKFCSSLRKHTKYITDFENKNILTLTKKVLKITSTYKSMLHLWKNN